MLSELPQTWPEQHAFIISDFLQVKGWGAALPGLLFWYLSQGYHTDGSQGYDFFSGWTQGQEFVSKARWLKAGCSFL